jgi:purine-binding chemotaxis protein CheW
MENQSATGMHQYLTFHIGAEEYAISILRVREIIEFSTLTRVPSMPPCVRGVLNLRGTVLPVVDLAVQFGIPEREVTKQTCVIIVDIELDGQLTMIGIMADGVNEVIDLAADQIEPPPAFGSAVADYLTGFARTQNGFVMMLDVGRALTAEALQIDQLAAGGIVADAAQALPPEPAEAACKAAHAGTC